jgi:hypothetical protein
MTTPPDVEVPMDFRALVDELLADFFRLQPVQATELGSHP